MFSVHPVVPDKQPVLILLPFKDQKSADVLKKELYNLSNRTLQLVYTSRKLGFALISVKEQKLSDQSTQCDLQIFMSSV